VAEWRAYNRLEPVGQTQIVYMLAMFTSTVVNIARRVWGRKNVKMTQASDYIPKWGPPEVQSFSDMKNIAQAIINRSGRKRKKR
jgi:hypothetical protein